MFSCYKYSDLFKDSNLTRVFAVTAKIRSLYDCQLRLMHNIQPLPSGIDIANTVKYFSQTLLSKYNKV